MLLGFVQDDEYWADHGILVACDSRGDDADEADPDPGPGIDQELLELGALQAQPGGTVAQAGAGWLWGRTSDADGYHIARLEAHDGPAADDRGDWDEVLETPYWSRTGTVQLAILTAGWDPDAGALSIGRPGRYRVRVSCVRDGSLPGTDEYRPVGRRTPPGFPGQETLTADGAHAGFDQGDIWRLQFWSAPDDLEPPRWLVRTEPLGQDADDRTGDDGELAEAASDGPADGELPDPELPDPDLPFGHFPNLATDLIFVALWTPTGMAYSVAELAARMLATPDEVRAGLTTARYDGQLEVVGDLPDDRAPIALTPLADEPPGYGPQPIVAAAGARPGFGYAMSDSGDADDDGQDDDGEDLAPALIASGTRRISVSWSRPAAAAPSLPDGPPPAAGIVTSNQELVVWRAGVPTVLAKVERYARRALATPHGIVVVGSKLAVLVRPDGEQLELAPSPDSRVALSGDGQHIAIASSQLGRRPRFGLHLADLTDGSAQVLDLPDFLSVDAVHGGVVRYGLAGDDEPACFSWAPGTAPSHAPCLEGEIDPVSGARITLTEPAELLAGDYLVTRQDGSELTVKRRHDAQESQLSPGGRWLYDFWNDPAAMTVTDVSGPVPGPAVTWPLPDGCETSLLGGRRPQWEDETHVLLTAPPWADVRAIRLDAATGAIERLRLDRHGCGEPGQREGGAEFDVETYVEPFLSWRMGRP